MSQGYALRQLIKYETENDVSYRARSEPLRAPKIESNKYKYTSLGTAWIPKGANLKTSGVFGGFIQHIHRVGEKLNLVKDNLTEEEMEDVEKIIGEKQ